MRSKFLVVKKLQDLENADLNAVNVIVIDCESKQLSDEDVATFVSRLKLMTAEVAILRDIVVINSEQVTDAQKKVFASLKVEFLKSAKLKRGDAALDYSSIDSDVQYVEIDSRKTAYSTSAMAHACKNLKDKGVKYVYCKDHVLTGDQNALNGEGLKVDILSGACRFLEKDGKMVFLTPEELEAEKNAKARKLEEPLTEEVVELKNGDAKLAEKVRALHEKGAKNIIIDLTGEGELTDDERTAIEGLPKARQVNLTIKTNNAFGAGLSGRYDNGSKVVILHSMEHDVSNLSTGSRIKFFYNFIYDLTIDVKSAGISKDQLEYLCVFLVAAESLERFEIKGVKNMTPDQLEDISVALAERKVNKSLCAVKLGDEISGALEALELSKKKQQEPKEPQARNMSFRNNVIASLVLAGVVGGAVYALSSSCTIAFAAALPLPIIIIGGGIVARACSPVSKSGERELTPAA